MSVVTTIVIVELMNSGDMIGERVEGEVMKEDTTEAMAMREEVLRGPMGMTIEEEIEVVTVTRAPVLVIIELLLIIIIIIEEAVAEVDPMTAEMRERDTTTTIPADTDHLHQRTGARGGAGMWIEVQVQQVEHKLLINQKFSLPSLLSALSALYFCTYTVLLYGSLFSSLPRDHPIPLSASN
jgi:hypothetical protein